MEAIAGFLLFFGIALHIGSLAGLFGAFIADTSQGTLYCIFLYVGINAALALCAFLWHLFANSKTGQEIQRKEYLAGEESRKRENTIIAQEYKEAVASNESGSPWQIRYATYPCPYCGHYKVRSAKWEDKRMSVAFWGAASSKIGTNFKCENCNMMW